MQLSILGWDTSLQRAFGQLESAGRIPARVAEEHRDRYVVFTGYGEKSAEISGKLRFGARSRLDYPAVGDWVVVDALPNENLAIIHQVLPRGTAFIRQSAGDKTEPQVVAANVDIVFLVTDMGLDYNLRRIERYLSLAYESGAAPVVVLNKSDLCHDRETRVTEVGTVALGVPVIAVSAELGDGMGQLLPFVGSGKTVGLIGSSGVGKSTIINYLLSEDRLKTNAVRESDGRGRHTTTARQLLLLPSGGMVIDTPGMREIQMWGDESQLAGSFADIEELSAQCRFTDCRHQSEPGCAIQGALTEGKLDEARWASYQKLLKELKFQERKLDIRARLDEKARWKKIHKSAKEIMRRKYGGR